MTVHSRFSPTAVLCLVGAAIFASTAAGQTPASGIAGPNLNAAPSQPPIEVRWNPTVVLGSWRLQMDLIVDPNAGPMEKHFQSPFHASGQKILLHAQQPFPLTVWEDFLILPVPGTPGVAVTDWHEEIITPGWEWVIPEITIPEFSVITRNGAPWPWSPIPMDPADPGKFWAAFPPIPPNNVLDVHKALLWVGTPGNRIWGDDRDDFGAPYVEDAIVVREYPTIPEPAAMWLFACAAALGWLSRWCKRRGG